MNFDSLFRTFLERPIYQRLFMAFTVGLFLSCAARVSEAQPGRVPVAAAPGVAHAPAPSLPAPAR
jgi:hypothetical protein